MHKSLRLALTAATAALLLAAALSTASARSLSTSNQNIRATWTSLEFASGEIIIRCPVTLEGSFHARTIAKVLQTLIGAVTRAVVKQEACTGGRGAAFNGTETYNGTTTPNTLPWHILYGGFRSRLGLPIIDSVIITIGRFRFGIRDSLGACTGQFGTAEDKVFADANREEGGAITSLVPIEGRNEVNLFRRDGGILCPTPGRMRGTGSVMLLNTTTRITVTLI